MQSSRKTILSLKTNKLGNILNNRPPEPRQNLGSFSSKIDYRKKKNEYSQGFDFIHLARAWEDIVGKLNAQNTLPVRIQGKSLIILCRHPGFAQQMTFMSDLLITAINKRFPGLKNQIQKLQFQHKSEIDFIEKIKNIQEEKIKVESQKQKYHPYSPEYRKAQLQADDFFKELPINEDTDKKALSLLKSLYVQLKLS